MINDIINLKSGINLVYGEGATGKTTLALMLAYEFSKFSKVVFIDTENGFSFDRFKQISGENYENCLKNVLLIKAKNFEEQIRVIKNLENIEKVSLIILDSLGMHYRLELKNDQKYANNKISEIFKILKLINEKNIFIFLTNQVYNNFDNNKLELVGGKMVRNLCGWIMKLEKNPRKLINESTNSEHLFDIMDSGIRLL